MTQGWIVTFYVVVLFLQVVCSLLAWHFGMLLEVILIYLIALASCVTDLVALEALFLEEGAFPCSV